MGGLNPETHFEHFKQLIYLHEPPEEGRPSGHAWASVVMLTHSLCCVVACTGAFTGPGGVALTLPDGALPNAGMRLYGGAQFHRAMAEFRLAVGQVRVHVEGA